MKFKLLILKNSVIDVFFEKLEHLKMQSSWKSRYSSSLNSCIKSYIEISKLKHYKSKIIYPIKTIYLTRTRSSIFNQKNKTCFD